MNKKIFAVKVGKVPGIYENFKEFMDQIRDQPGALRRSFTYDTELKDAGEEVEGSLANARLRAAQYLNEKDTDVGTSDCVWDADTPVVKEEDPIVRFLLETLDKGKLDLGAAAYSGPYSPAALFEMIMRLCCRLDEFFQEYLKRNSYKEEQDRLTELCNALEKSGDYNRICKRLRFVDSKKVPLYELHVRLNAMAQAKNEDRMQTEDKAYDAMYHFIMDQTPSLGELFQELTGNPVYRSELKELIGPSYYPVFCSELFEESAEEDEEPQTIGLQALTDRCEDLRKGLERKVIGQDQAIDGFVRMVFHSERERFSNPERKGPGAVFLFAGPPGVGKTMMAEEAVELLKLPHKRFDMTAYARDDTVDELVGISKFWKKARPGVLTSYVKGHPRCVLILDEIEKASPKVIFLFLQALSDGIIHDRYDEKDISFDKVIFIFTTNAGRTLYEGVEIRNLTELKDKEVINAIGADRNPVTNEPYFPSEMLSRFAAGNVIMFNALRASCIRQMIRKDIDRQIAAGRKYYDLDLSGGKEQLAATIQYCTGGIPDARIASRLAGKVIDSETMEVYSRAKEVFKTKGTGISRIEWSCDLSTASPEVQKLYQGEQDGVIALYGKHEQPVLPDELKEKGMEICGAANEEALEKLLGQEPVMFVVVDAPVEKLPSMRKVPWYVLDTAGEGGYSEADRRRYLFKGCRGFLDRGVLGEELLRAYREVNCDRAVEKLYLSHQVLAYDTKYELVEDQGLGKVIFSNMRLETAPDAADSHKPMRPDLNPGVHWEDICVPDWIREELESFIDILKAPWRYARKGVGVSRGLLLYGPPGTGKTSLAKVVATESGLPFMSVAADQMRSEGAEGVHEIFRTARKYAPMVLFIDEIDAVGKSREKEILTTTALNALLTELDGFNTDDDRPVFVMAATNLLESLDPALLRRFDRTMQLDLPGRKDYVKLLRKLLGRSKGALAITDDKLENLAQRAEGMRVSPACLEKVVAMALRESIRRDCDIDDEILDEALEKHLFGEDTPEEWEDAERREQRTACHEAGHALIQLYFGQCPSYMSVVARGDHGGYVMADPYGEANKEKLLEKICGLLAGRGAELVYGYGLTPGASSDLKKATNIAKAMVCKYGMYEEEIGLSVIEDGEVSQRNEVKNLVDRILHEQQTRAMGIIMEKRPVMDRLIRAVTSSEKKYLVKSEIQAAYDGADENPAGAPEEASA